MSDIYTLMQEHGITLGALTNGKSALPEVRDVYSALKDGAEVVFAFGNEADDSLLSLFASSEQCEAGEIIVLQASTLDAATFKSRIHNRNSLNVNPATGKPRAKSHLGSVSISDGIRNADGSIVGYAVRAA